MKIYSVPDVFNSLIRYRGETRTVEKLKAPIHPFICLGKKRFSETEYFLIHGIYSVWQILEATRK